MSHTRQNIDWEWILDNMRRCDKCYIYKTLDQFKSKRDRCRYCEVKRRNTMKTKPVAHQYADDSVICRSFDLKELHIQNGVKPIIRLRRIQ